MCHTSGNTYIILSSWIMLTAMAKRNANIVSFVFFPLTNATSSSVLAREKDQAKERVIFSFHKLYFFLLGVGVCEEQVVTPSCLAMLSPSMRLCSSGLSSGKMFKRFLEVPESMQSSSVPI